jgi:hypothetical protein
MSYVLCWLFLCVAAAMFAHIRRNRNGFGWFVVSFFFSPLVAFILLLILEPKRIVFAVAPPRGDPRWANLRAGVELEPAIAVPAAVTVVRTRDVQAEQRAAIFAAAGIGTVLVLIGVLARLVG